jgi:LDH2 family malate/lactate/ureidoglycolate dehydrogenase
MIGLCVTNGPPWMAPPGGTKRLVGTNPWSIAVPGRGFPVVMDLAVTTVGWTRLALSAMRGEAIPTGWAVGADGNPTTDPAAAMAGMLLPMGGHKGFALGVMADLLTDVLGGDRMAEQVVSYRFYLRHSGVSHLLGALQVSAFLPLEEFTKRVDAYVGLLTRSPRAAQTKEILVPGQRSRRTHEARMKHGIPLHPRVAHNLIGLGDELGIPFPAA